MYENCKALVGLAGLILIIACGGTQPEPAAPPPEPAPEAAPPPEPAAEPAAEAAPAEPATPPEPPVPEKWSADLTKEQKAAFMKANVQPRMAKVFQEASAEKYANFDCKSCHGPDWKLPKDFLPKLTMKGGKLQGGKADVAKFMADKVVPEMAAILGTKPFDPKTKEGFGCMGCHTVEMK